eukprot:scaffold8363_cov58-Attheya_sp.AAC.1
MNGHDISKYGGLRAAVLISDLLYELFTLSRECSIRQSNFGRFWRENMLGFPSCVLRVILLLAMLHKIFAIAIEALVAAHIYSRTLGYLLARTLLP